MAGESLIALCMDSGQNLRKYKVSAIVKTHMKRQFLKLLSGLAAFGIVTSAYSLTIIPTFDSSITTNANAAAIEAAINFSIGTLQSNLTDNATVKILFRSEE